ncbi:MAG: hypothetical protein MUF78_02980 [Candidatus Edwardsbacteria bacterium]|jgi:hypothetical protein|nr:hypothetical protein [Candidatus Edwardsbacteria bacterium]
MKFKLSIGLVLGVLLTAFGAWGLFASHNPAKFIPLAIGLSLITMSFWRNRRATILLGHVIVTCGCFLITYGIYLLPYAKPDLAHILGLPLFWGLFCLFGGICAIYHGFCNCVRCPAKQ